MAISASILLLREVPLAGFDAALAFGGVGARGPKDGASARENARHRMQVERHDFVLHHSAPAFEEADKFILVVKNAFANRAADHRVQSRTIAAAGQDADSHTLSRAAVSYSRHTQSCHRCALTPASCREPAFRLQKVRL